MNRRNLIRFVAVMASVVVLALSLGSVLAITDGEPDGEGHPQVGIMVAVDYDTGGAWRCSGTMISPTVYLTAGHCTYGADVVYLWFVPEIGPGMGWPFNSEISSTNIHVHPQYNDNAFYLYDVGAVILDKPIEGVEYASVPSDNVLDALSTARGQIDRTITAVGYGLQRVRSNPAGPDFTESDLRREFAVLDMVDVNGIVGIPDGTAVTLSGNANTGGTCSGDSGGPLFLNDTLTIVAVNSFGLNGNCAGVGGGYRIDQPDDIAFINDVLAASETSTGNGRGKGRNK